MQTLAEDSPSIGNNTADQDLNRALREIYKSYGPDLAAFFDEAVQSVRKGRQPRKSVKPRSVA